jgi:hypothetical protein
VGNKDRPSDSGSEHLYDFFKNNFIGEPRFICRIGENRVRKFQGEVVDILKIGDSVFLKIKSSKVKIKEKIRDSNGVVRQTRVKWVPGECMTVIPLGIVEHAFTVKATKTQEQKVDGKIVGPDEEEVEEDDVEHEDKK